jgi:hypothetical protein
MFLGISFSFFQFLVYCGCLDIAPTVPPEPNYVYILNRLKMSKEPYGPFGSGLFCYYGETNYVFLIGVLADTCETLMVSVIRHYRHLVIFKFTQNNRLYLTKVIDGFMNHEPIQTLFFVIDINSSK